MIYGIIVFGHRKGSGIHWKGFWMFPEMFGYENTLFGPKGRWRPPMGLNWTRGRGWRPPCLFLLPLSFPYGPIRPNTSPRRIPITLRYSDKYPNHSEPFRSPNIVVQYIDLYVSTISRLLVMSPISSGTPNSFGTSKIINS